jgi:hypothetical protein
VIRNADGARSLGTRELNNSNPERRLAAGAAERRLGRGSTRVQQNRIPRENRLNVEALLQGG